MTKRRLYINELTHVPIRYRAFKNGDLGKYEDHSQLGSMGITLNCHCPVPYREIFGHETRSLPLVVSTYRAFVNPEFIRFSLVREK